MSEVHAPLMGPYTPYGKSWICHCLSVSFLCGTCQFYNSRLFCCVCMNFFTSIGPMIEEGSCGFKWGRERSTPTPTVASGLVYFFIQLIVYRMGRLCGGAHEISGIKAPLFLSGGWLEGSWGGWEMVGW